jgi:hypothetical protein
MVHVVLYGADKAVIVYIVHSELYRIITLYNNYDYYSIDITASATTIPLNPDIPAYFERQNQSKNFPFKFWNLSQTESTPKRIEDQKSPSPNQVAESVPPSIEADSDQ